MFPSIDALLQVGVAMAILYALLGAASLSVRLSSRGTAPGNWSRQVNGWWRILPFVTVALLTCPLGLVLLGGLVYALAVAELAPYYPGPRRVVIGGATAILASAAVLAWSFPQAALALFVITIVLSTLQRQPGALIWCLLAATAGAMAILAAFPTLPLATTTMLGWLFYLFIVTALNDVGQFIAGKLFGRTRLAPAISPNKTWQGVAGGLVVSLCVSELAGTLLALAGPVRLAVFAVLLSLGGLAGDLLFSHAKRRLQIKDFSQLIPGHGGILDRVDSLVVTAPLLYFLLTHFA